MKNANDTIGNRNRDLSACSAVPQPTASPAAFPKVKLYCKKYLNRVFTHNSFPEFIFTKEYKAVTAYWLRINSRHN